MLLRIEKKPRNHYQVDCRDEEMADTMIPDGRLDYQIQSRLGEKLGWRSCVFEVIKIKIMGNRTYRKRRLDRIWKNVL